MERLTLIFKSSCCNKLKETGAGSTSCQSYARFPPQLQAYVESLSHVTMSATTITIGNKWIGSMSLKKQYKTMREQIKKHMRQTKLESIYVFEIQANGQLHAHGLEIGWNQATFIENFQHYGQRNRTDASYEKVRHLSKYLEYLQKDLLYMYKNHRMVFITNIKKKTVLNFHETPSLGVDAPAGGHVLSI